MGEQLIYAGLFAFEDFQAVRGIAELYNAENEGEQYRNEDIDEHPHGTDSACRRGVIGIIASGLHHYSHCEGACNAENGGYEIKNHLSGYLDRHKGESGEHGMGIGHAHSIFGILFE